MNLYEVELTQWKEVGEFFTHINNLKETFHDFSNLEEYKYSVLPDVIPEIKKLEPKDEPTNKNMFNQMSSNDNMYNQDNYRVDQDENMQRSPRNNRGGNNSPIRFQQGNNNMNMNMGNMYNNNNNMYGNNDINQSNMMNTTNSII